MPTPAPRQRTRTAAPGRQSRRDQLALIAAGLFAQQGFHNVSVNDIAAAAGISGPAIYRHFKNKQAILAHLVVGGLAQAADIVERHLGDGAAREGAGGDGAAPEGVSPAERLGAAHEELAAFVVGSPEFGVLWRREGRHLAAADAEEVTKAAARATVPLAAALGELRPELHQGDAELLTWSALSVFGSISDHRVRLPQTALEDLLTAIALDVLAADVPAARERGGQSPAAQPRAALLDSRREQLLAVAAGLFWDRGYHAVTMEEIGAAAGIAGPSIYSHFGGKMELLQTVANRIGEHLRQAVFQAQRADLEAGATLGLLARSYVDTVTEHRDLVAAYFREGHNLPGRDRAEVRRFQQAYTQYWVDLVAAVAPERSAKETRIRVHAAFALVNDIAQTKRFMARPYLADDLHPLMLTVLLPGRSGTETGAENRNTAIDAAATKLPGVSDLH
ncbi:TetR/AcrR family transcriptional regulator [Streptomyces sp. NPDC093544]|jgi:AcrR family transcriptional regulator|uniref:TetR/AcrR family transcriptional regulator n=1 Tax=Streptomyces sp. NPDC093544 TaxID=3155200 RepID=UPI00341A70B6